VSSEDELDVHVYGSQRIKSGLRQMIAQAWDKHRRQQLAISVDKRRFQEILMAD
jgi:hypothetical protein